MFRRFYVPLVVALLFIAGCSSISENYYRVEGFAQGTTYSITYEDVQQRDLSSGIDSILSAIDSSMSVYATNSVISKFNRNESLYADPMLVDVVKQSVTISRVTNGAFDITVGPLVKAWGFGPNGKQTPDSSHIDELLSLVGMDKITIKGDSVIKLNPNVVIDVNAIAQGYTVDVIAEYFESMGITNYLVEVGGEIRTLGVNAKGTDWVVGIDKPVDNAVPGAELQVKLSLSGKSLATSGNYRKFYEENGVKYSHTINPKTGFPARHTLLSATVIAKTAAQADAYATALMVMGFENAVEFVHGTPDIEAYLVHSSPDGKYLEWMSPGIREMIKD
ncbi:MAG TPA: FAD:protein FMN transferase [Tenuifilaceae bacterium]|nr:FAD:protein FMN transferase [Tenuifilaceae bacterium]